MKDEQKKLDVLEHLIAFISRHSGRMTPEQVSEELQIPLYAVQRFWPNPSR